MVSGARAHQNKSFRPFKVDCFGSPAVDRHGCIRYFCCAHVYWRKMHRMRPKSSLGRSGGQRLFRIELDDCSMEYVMCVPEIPDVAALFRCALSPNAAALFLCFRGTTEINMPPAGCIMHTNAKFFRDSNHVGSLRTAHISWQ